MKFKMNILSPFLACFEILLAFSGALLPSLLCWTMLHTPLHEELTQYLRSSCHSFSHFLSTCSSYILSRKNRVDISSFHWLFLFFGFLHIVKSKCTGCEQYFFHSVGWLYTYIYLLLEFCQCKLFIGPHFCSEFFFNLVFIVYLHLKVSMSESMLQEWIITFCSAPTICSA